MPSALLSRALRLPTRSFAASTRYSKLMGDNPAANQPDSNARKVRTDTPNTDKQSSASPDEDKSGDDHPAKQPDYQAIPSRSTGVGGGSEVKGGKEGLGEVSGNKLKEQKG
jgi:hypothetical protein